MDDTIIHRILVVDDNADIRWILSDLLTVHGFHCEQAHDGITALSTVVHARFHVILTDYQMPNMDGMELLHNLTALPNTASIPVIMITAFGDETLEVEARRAGACAVLRKPIDSRELLTVITQAIEHTQPPFSNPCQCG
ncbi:MAG: Fis family transcriptional regulator [Nitrospirales bacterium]|nr:MAG: Fis family transcriptional regulator [Nitrospirales bacterium]